MDPVDKHSRQPDVTFDGGDLDCGNGLLLLIRKHLDPMSPGQLLEIKSVESSVDEDLPAWCRLTKNTLLSWTKSGPQRSFLIEKAAPHSRPVGADLPFRPQHSPAPPVPPLSVMGIGSWPRPKWMLRALHDYLESKLPESEFQESADDAVRLAVQQQLAAGATVLTDGEQRRDSYSSFVGLRLENVQLIPLVDLLPLVDHPEDFQHHLQQMDIPTDLVRHPAVFGKINRKPNTTIAAHELTFLRSIAPETPLKVSLPGPYLLTRTMFLDCFKERAYETRDDLAGDVVRILREEIADVLDAGASLVQLDEPILTEIVFGAAHGQRTFMCGALSERSEDKEKELQFALRLLNAVVSDFPRERLAMHVCRGNWTADETVALSGGYADLLPIFQHVKVGTLFLEFCTPRAGDIDVLASLPKDIRVGFGCVNPKDPVVESVEDVLKRARQAESIIGADRLLLNPDCGFATFADSPVAKSETATRKLAVIAEVSKRLKNNA